jgi:hypothetical protein
MRKCSVSQAMKRLQIKLTLRFYPSPVRLAIIMKTKNNCCWGFLGKRTLYSGVGMLIRTTTMEISMEVHQKTKNRTIVWSCYTTLGYISKGMHVRIQYSLWHTCLFHNYSQQPSYGNSLSAHQQMNG